LFSSFLVLPEEESDDDDEDEVDIADDDDGHDDDDDETELPSSPVQSKMVGGEEEETLTTLSCGRGCSLAPTVDVVAMSEALYDPFDVSFEPCSVVRAEISRGGDGKTGEFPT
jgi:hypothetical protein